MMTGVTASGKAQVPVIDRVTKSLQAIESDHANIHEGMAYGAWRLFNIAAGQSAYMLLLAPASAYVHLKPAVMSTDGPAVLVEIAEGGTVASNGTAITPRNKRRVGTTPDAATMEVYYAPGTPVVGTTIDSDYLGGGTAAGQSKTGASMPGKDEIILKRGEKYLIKITNSGAAAVNAHIKLFWYEEPAG